MALDWGRQRGLAAGEVLQLQLPPPPPSSPPLCLEWRDAAASTVLLRMLPLWPQTTESRLLWPQTMERPQKTESRRPSWSSWERGWASLWLAAPR